MEEVDGKQALKLLETWTTLQYYSSIYLSLE
jgi:hypothetical protein